MGKMPLERVVVGRGKHSPEFAVGHVAVVQIHHNVTITVALGIAATVQLEFAQCLQLSL